MKKLIDAKGKFVLNAGDLTGYIMCCENGYATVFDRFAKVICKFSFLDAPPWMPFLWYMGGGKKLMMETVQYVLFAEKIFATSILK